MATETTDTFTKDIAKLKALISEYDAALVFEAFVQLHPEWAKNSEHAVGQPDPEVDPDCLTYRLVNVKTEDDPLGTQDHPVYALARKEALKHTQDAITYYEMTNDIKEAELAHVVANELASVWYAMIRRLTREAAQLWNY
jgi:hypothetical protein